MITLISGTNRPNSNTKKIALQYLKLLKEKQQDCQLLALDEVSVTERDAAFKVMEEKFFHNVEKIIILMPEYNGSYPGILKMLFDNSDIRKCFWHKKVLLTGISTGRAGNLRGMDHLTGVLLYLKMTVHFNRLPISRVETLLDKNDEVNDVMALESIDYQLAEFLAF
jgi:NAD(P)H-dependent FMN reductase